MKKILFIFSFSMLFCSGILAVAAHAQERVVTGVVTSAEDDSPLPGVNVVVQGTNKGTITGIDGEYRISVPEGQQSLVFTYIGYEKSVVRVGNKSEIIVALESGNELLSEVVIVGYGEQSERAGLQSVSKIDSEEFENQPVVNPQELLQGRAAGVQMVGTSGVLGSAATIRIRGVASISAGGQPLFVIDGVPLNDASGQAGGYSNGLGAVPLNPLQDLNPNDIESISVLKDASAVAIYGSRGANGVVIITTKKGNEGRARINFDYYTGVSEPTELIDMMNADQYRNFVSSYRTAQGFDTRTEPSDFPQGSFDWPDAVVRTGKINNYSLSASGGSESTNFYLSGTYFNQEGYTIGNEIDKLNGRLNVSHNLNDRVRFGANIAISRVENDRISSDNSTFAPLTSSYLQQPYVEPYNEDGTYTNTGFIANVLAIEDLSIRELITRRTTGNVYVEFDLLPSLRLKTDIGADMIQTKEKTRDPEIVSPGGYGYERLIQDNKWLTTNTLDYSNTFGDHYVGGLLGFSLETSRFESITVEGTGFVSDQLPNVGSAATPSITSATGTEWALSSQFARLNYRFKERYLLEGSIRRDGSSRFGEDNQWGTFWAVSAGWILSDEQFIRDLDFFDLMKLTASYGIAGNDRISNFGALGLYGGGTLSDYAGLPGLRPTQAANPDLGWEETAQFDVGINLLMLDSRLGVEANYYIKQTDGLLLGLPLPYITGFGDINQNVGEMENRGVDLHIYGKVVDKPGLSWNLDLNMGFLENEVISLPENRDGQGRNFLIGSASQRAIEGHPVNTFYLIRYAGINTETGDAQWYTRNGEITNSPTANDRVIVGSAIPDFTGGFSSRLRVKGFEFNFLWNFSYGNMVMRDGRRFTENMASNFNKSVALLDYWEQPGDESFAPGLGSPTAAQFAQRSTLQLEEGSFIRLRNITLAYSLPQSLLDATNVLRRARIYVMGQNLLTFSETDLEPEINGDGTNNQIQGEAFFTPPQARTITFGVTLGL